MSEALNHTSASMPELTPFRDQIERLGRLEPELRAFPHDTSLRIEAGYAALHAAREVAEAIFRRDTGRTDIAPGLAGPESLDRSQELFNDFVAQVMADRIELDPLAEMAVILAAPKTLRALGRATTGACVALLGLHEYGGVFGAWQLQILAFNRLTWQEHVAFNERILADARRIRPVSAIEMAERYSLPPLAYVRAGSIGNILKASYRAIATNAAAASEWDASDVAERAYVALEKDTPDDTKGDLLMDTMRAMRAAIAEHLDSSTTAHTFWARVDNPEGVLTDLRRIEPSAALVRLVEESAARHL